MSVRSGSAVSSRGSGEFREIRLPNSKAVKALIYFCGRDPRKAKSVRRYYDDDFDTRSTGSGGSMFSWSSGTSGVYLVETTAPYWYWDEQVDAVSYTSSSSKNRKSSKRGRSSRQSQRSNQPTGTWQRRATVEDDDDDESSDDGSENFGDRGPSPYPHPNMMHPMPQPGPPPGAFQPMYGMPQYSQHATPRPTPPNGMPMPPPPPPMAGGMPPPPPSGGHFVTGRGGIQVFVDG